MIKHLEHLKAWDITGITSNHQHGAKAHKVFIEVEDKMLVKLEQFEEAGKYGLVD